MRRTYRRQGDFRVECTQCGSRFYLGNPLHLKSRKYIDGVLRGLREQRSAANTIEGMGISSSSYFSHLQRIGVVLRDWQAYKNAHLLQPGYAGWNEPILAYSDTARITLQRSGDGRRTQYLNLTATVIRLGQSHFVLAAHPSFLPDAYCPDHSTLLADEGKPDYLQEWGCLEFGYGTPSSATVMEMQQSLSDLGRSGFFSGTPYSELVHFLVVGKLLSRIRKIHLYLDGSLPLYSAAFVAFANEIREGRVEIALFQHAKDRTKVRPDRILSKEQYSTKKDRMLDAAWYAMQEELTQRVNSYGDDASERDISREYAKAFRYAFRGANSSNGGWAWLPFPPSTQQYRDPFSLWLTWNRSKDYEKVGRELLRHVTLQPIDSVFHSFRSRSRGTSRARSRATQGRSYVESYVDPLNVMSELWVSMFEINYQARKRKKVVPRARRLNLMRANAKPPDPERIASNFRLGVNEAEEITQWVSR